MDYLDTLTQVLSEGWSLSKDLSDKDLLLRSFTWLLTGFNSLGLLNWGPQFLAGLETSFFFFSCGLSVGHRASQIMRKWEGKGKCPIWKPMMEPRMGSYRGSDFSTLVTFYSLEVCDYIQPWLKGKIHKGKDTGGGDCQEPPWRLLLILSIHSVPYSVLIWISVGQHHSGSNPLAFYWVLPIENPGRRIKKEREAEIQ